VVTNYKPAMRLAQEAGWRFCTRKSRFLRAILWTPLQRSAKNEASPHCALALDVPLILSNDIDELSPPIAWHLL